MANSGPVQWTPVSCQQSSDLTVAQLMTQNTKNNTSLQHTLTPDTFGHWVKDWFVVVQGEMPFFGAAQHKITCFVRETLTVDFLNTKLQKSFPIVEVNQCYLSNAVVFFNSIKDQSNLELNFIKKLSFIFNMHQIL